ncbi:MAG: hypothetical protein NVS2B7_36960 [Herpetosiphon sp.]
MHRFTQQGTVLFVTVDVEARQLLRYESRSTTACGEQPNE